MRTMRLCAVLVWLLAVSGPIPVPMPWTAPNQIPFYGASGPTVAAAPTDSNYHLTLGPGGSLIWSRKGRVDIADEIDLLTGSDHSAAFKTLIAAHGAGSTFFLRDGATLKLPLQTTTLGGGSGIPNLPAKSRLVGGGAGSVVQVTGWETVTNASSRAAIEIYGASKEDATIEGLTFVGDWTSRGGGPGSWTNGQPAVIWIYSADNTLRRATVRNCVFADHWGFPVHGAGNEYGSVLERCDFYRCGNGPNVNGSYAKILRNFVTASEGIETAGTACEIDGNVLIDVLHAGISVGGNAENVNHPAQRVTRNVVIGCDGVGIISGESAGDLLVLGNYVERATNYGYQFTGGAATSGPNDGVRAVGNSAISIAVGTGAAGFGTSVRCGFLQFHDNVAYNLAAYDTMLYGAIVNSPDLRATGNDLRGKSYAVQFGSSAERVFWDESNGAVAGSNGIYAIDAATSFQAGSVLQVAVPSSFWKPAAAARFRGVTINYSAPNGAADYKQICRKDAADAYAWVDLF
jgi:hypothetical protein